MRRGGGGGGGGADDERWEEMDEQKASRDERSGEWV